MSRPDRVSQIRALPSIPAVARCRPSGLNATLITDPLPALTLRSSLPVETLQMPAVSPVKHPAAATVLPSGAKSTPQRALEAWIRWSGRRERVPQTVSEPSYAVTASSVPSWLRAKVG